MWIHFSINTKQKKHIKCVYTNSMSDHFYQAMALIHSAVICAVRDQPWTMLWMNLKAKSCDILSSLWMLESWLCSLWIEFPSADLSGSWGGRDNQTHTDKRTAVRLTPLQDVCHTSISTERMDYDTPHANPLATALRHLLPDLSLCPLTLHSAHWSQTLINYSIQADRSVRISWQTVFIWLNYSFEGIFIAETNRNIQKKTEHCVNCLCIRDFTDYQQALNIFYI